MSLDDLSKVIEHDTLPIDIAANYLTLYLGEEDWQKHIKKLWINLETKNKNSELSKEQIKNIISCAMLLPTVEKVTIPDPVYQILFWCTSWSQLGERNWFSLLKDVVKKDLIIQENRKKLLRLGIIDPIDYSPLTRQAYNWLYTECQSSVAITESNSSFVQSKMQNLVRIYGGAVISNMFTNYKNNIQKVYNWKNGYFFEREIYNVYSIDQIQKIKSLEIQKLNPKYIKTIASK